MQSLPGAAPDGFRSAPAPFHPIPRPRDAGIGQSIFLTLVGLLVVYAAIGLFVYPDWINIGIRHDSEELAEVRIMGMPTPDMAFVLVLGFTFLANIPFRRIVLSPPGLAFIGVMGAYSFMGLAMGNAVNWLREDWRIWLWGVAGFAMFHLIMRTRRPCFHLLTITLIAAVVLLVSAESARNIMSNDEYLQNGRVWDLNVFKYAGVMIIFLGLILSLCALKNLFYLAGTLAALGIFFYSAVMVSATRSLALGLIMVCALAVPTLMFERNRDVITLRVGGRAIWVAGVVCIAGLLVIATFFGLAFAGSTVLADRWKSDDIDSGLDRFVEAGDAFAQLGVLKAIIGGGLGFTFESIFDYTAVSLHLGVFVFLLKFGIVPFVAVVAFLYVFLPYKFVQALALPRALDPRLRTAILVTLPGVLGWALILTMSGGYDHYFFIGVGFSLGVFNEVRAHGLREICR